MDETKSTVGSPPEPPEEMKTVSTAINLLSPSTHRLRPPTVPISTEKETVRSDEGEEDESESVTNEETSLELSVAQSETRTFWNPIGHLFSPKYRFLDWTLMGGSLTFALLMTFGYFAMQRQLSSDPFNPYQNSPIRLSVVAPSLLAKGIETTVELQVENLVGDVQATPIRLCLRNELGEELLVQHEMTDSHGYLSSVLEVPVSIPTPVWFEAVAKKNPQIRIVHAIPVIDAPLRVETVFGEETVLESQLVELTALMKEFIVNEPLRFKVQAHSPDILEGELYAVVSQNGIPIAQRSFSLQNEAASLEIPLPGKFVGFFQITLFDGRLTPPAEISTSSFFRRGIKYLRIEQLEPTEKMLPLRVVDEQGHAVQANLHLTWGKYPLIHRMPALTPLLLNNTQELVEIYSQNTVRQFNWNFQNKTSKFFLFGLLGILGTGILILFFLSLRILASPFPILMIVLMGILAFCLGGSLHHQYKVCHFAVKTIREQLQQTETKRTDSEIAVYPSIPELTVPASEKVAQTDLQGYYQILDWQLLDWNLRTHETEGETTQEYETRSSMHIRIEAEGPERRLGFVEIIH